MITCLIRGVADGIPNGSHAWKQKGKTVNQSKGELDVAQDIQKGEAGSRDIFKRIRDEKVQYRGSKACK